jgi:hypothetical protein
MATDWFLEEYKIVQVKIDEVLKSQFQVRSWSVTLLTAAVFGVVGTGRSPLWLVFSLPVVLIFQLLDLRQKWFRKTLAARAADLESAINLLGLPTQGFDPVQKKRWLRLREVVPNLRGVPGAARVLAQQNIGREYSRSWAETLFYVTQYGTISVIIILDIARTVFVCFLNHIFELLVIFAALIRVLSCALDWLCA